MILHYNLGNFRQMFRFLLFNQKKNSTKKVLRNLMY